MALFENVLWLLLWCVLCSYWRLLRWQCVKNAVSIGRLGQLILQHLYDRFCHTEILIYVSSKKCNVFPAFRRFVRIIFPSVNISRNVPLTSIITEALMESSEFFYNFMSIQQRLFTSIFRKVIFLSFHNFIKSSITLTNFHRTIDLNKQINRKFSIFIIETCKPTYDLSHNPQHSNHMQSSWWSKTRSRFQNVPFRHPHAIFNPRTSNASLHMHSALRRSETSEIFASKGLRMSDIGTSMTPLWVVFEKNAESANASAVSSYLYMMFLFVCSRDARVVRMEFVINCV